MMPSVFTLTVPAAPTSLRVMRSVASAAAAEADLGFDSVDDLSLAIDEAGGALIEFAAAGSLRCAVHREDHGLAVTIASGADVPLDTAWPPADWKQSMGALVLAAVAPDLEYLTIDDKPSITFTVP